MAYDREEHSIGYGKKLFHGDTLVGATNQVFGTRDIQLPERELGTAELTNDSSPDYHKDYTPGLYEPGTVTFTYVYGKTAFAALEAIFQLAGAAGTRATATKFWKVELPDGSTATFKGFMTKHDLPLEVEGEIVVEGEIQVCGKMTFTPAVEAP